MSKTVFKLVRKFLESTQFPIFRQIEKIHLSQLMVSNIPAENALNDICTVKTVHAVGSKSSFLCLNDNDILEIVKLFLIIKPDPHLSHKVAIASQFFFTNIH